MVCRTDADCSLRPGCFELGHEKSCSRGQHCETGHGGSGEDGALRGEVWVVVGCSAMKGKENESSTAFMHVV